MCHEVLLGSGEVSPVAVGGVARLDGEADEREHDGPADDDGRLLLGFDRRRRGEVQAKADGDDASDDDVGVLVLLRLSEGGLGEGLSPLLVPDVDHALREHHERPQERQKVQDVGLESEGIADVQEEQRPDDDVGAVEGVYLGERVFSSIRFLSSGAGFHPEGDKHRDRPKD